jgi:hypothetical protein
MIKKITFCTFFAGFALRKHPSHLKVKLSKEMKSKLKSGTTGGNTLSDFQLPKERNSLKTSDLKNQKDENKNNDGAKCRPCCGSSVGGLRNGHLSLD